MSQNPHSDPSDEDRDRIQSQYESCVRLWLHCNAAQTEYRKLAATWLLGALGAIGYLLNVETIKLGTYKFDNLLGVMFASAAGAIGIALIGILDLLVYRRLLLTSYAAALSLEHPHRWLVPVHHNMHFLELTVGLVSKVVWFYILEVEVLALVGFGALAVHLGALNASGVVQSALVILLAVILLVIYVVFRRPVKDAFRIIASQSDLRTDVRDHPVIREHFKALGQLADKARTSITSPEH